MTRRARMGANAVCNVAFGSSHSDSSSLAFKTAIHA